MKLINENPFVEGQINGSEGPCLRYLDYHALT